MSWNVPIYSMQQQIATGGEVHIAYIESDNVYDNIPIKSRFLPNLNFNNNIEDI